MKHLLLAVLLLWGATLAFPGLRERAEPRVASSRAWLGERMDVPLFKPFRDRYRTAQAESHLSKAQRALIFTRNQGGNPPDQGELRGFMSRFEIVDDGLDPWGTPYIVVMETDSLAVISAGPDLQYHTEDDIVVRVRFRQRGPPRPTFRQ